MGPIDRSRFKFTCEKIIKKINTLLFSDEPSTTTLNTAKSTMAFFSSEAGPSGSWIDISFASLDAKDECEYRMDFLPPPNQFFPGDFINIPVLPVFVYYDDATLFDLPNTPMILRF